MLPAMSLSKAFDLSLVSRQASHVAKRRVYNFTAASQGSIMGKTFAPNTMGTSIATLAGVFARWRIVKAIFTYLPFQSGSTTPGQVQFGVSDDVGGEGGTSPVPTNAYEVMNLRCATSTCAGESAEFEWKPLDPNKWYYTFGTGTASDQRFVVPGTLYVIYTAGSGTAAAIIDARFTIEFAGDAGDGSQ